MKKEKIKLTNLRQLETSKEEMDLIKGGDQQIWACKPACDCTTSCTNYTESQQTHFEMITNHNRDKTNLSAALDGIMTGLQVVFGAKLFK